MIHEEKLTHMQIALNIVGYNFDSLGIDMIASIYELVSINKGLTDINSICRVKQEVNDRELTRIHEKKVKEAI